MGRVDCEAIVCEESVFVKMVKGSEWDSVPFSRAAVDRFFNGVDSAFTLDGVTGASRVQFKLRFLMKGFSMSFGLGGRLVFIVSLLG